MAKNKKPVFFGRFFGVRLPDELAVRLRTWTHTHKTSASVIVRQALAEFFSRRRAA